MPIRFHLDESMPNAVAEGLRRRGLDVTTSGEANQIAARDDQQLDFARDAGRLLVTRDQDFVRSVLRSSYTTKPRVRRAAAYPGLKADGKTTLKGLKKSV